MINIYIIIPIISNIIFYLLLPTNIFILLCVISSIYMIFYVKEGEKQTKVTLIDYILSTILLAIIVFVRNEIKFCILPLEIMFITKILISNLVRCKEDSKLNDKSKYSSEIKNDITYENQRRLNNIDIEKLLESKMSEELKDLQKKIEKLTQHTNKNIENNQKISEESIDCVKKDLEKTIYRYINNLHAHIQTDITNSIEDLKINITQNNIMEEHKDYMDRILYELNNKNFSVDEQQIKEIIEQELRNNTWRNIKDELTRNIIQESRDGSINILNTKHLKNKEVRQKFIETFYNAKEEIDIVSPWIANWTTKDNELIDGLKFALNQGVNIKILYGIGNVKSNKLSNAHSDRRSIDTDKNAEELKKMFKGYKGQLLFKKVNTHEKILLCDDKYFLEGSYNLLSFKGDYNGYDMRDESMYYQENKSHIQKLRKEYFNF